METKETNSRADLLAAWLASDGARDSHPDIADYYYRQVWALARAFDCWGPGIRFTETPIEETAGGLRAAYTALMLDLMERIWGIGPDQTVSRESVIENGFDPDAPAPNFDHYW